MPARTYSVSDRGSDCERTVANVREGQGPRIRLNPRGEPWLYVQMVMGTVTGSVSLTHYSGIATTDMSYCRVLAVLSRRNHTTGRFTWGTLSHLGGGDTKYVNWDKLARRHAQVGGPHFGVVFSINAISAADWTDYETVFDKFGVLRHGRFAYQANTRECDVGIDFRGGFGELTNGLARSFQSRPGSNLQGVNGNGWEALNY